jgi:uncharacterized membrane protein YbhN (UPF0104 family)
MPSRRRFAALSTAIGLAVAAAGFVFVGSRLASEWSEVRDAVSDAQTGWLVLGLIGAVVGMVGIAWAWRPVLDALGAAATTAQALRWYFPGELGKYVPGGIWPVVGRAELATRAGIRRSVAYASVALSLFALYLAAMAVATIALPAVLVDERDSSAPLLVLLLLPVGVLALHPAVIRAVMRPVERLLKREVRLDVPEWRTSLGLVARYVPAWAFIGGATWCIARAFDPSAPFGQVFFAAVLSWIVGFVLVPVPGGIGVREAAFVATAGLPAGIGATVALAARLAFMLVDAGGAVAAPALTRGSARRVRAP